MRTLVVVRHGKAVAHAASDHARELTARGRAAAEDVGRYLREAGLRPERALVSSAARSVGTWEALVRGLGEGPAVEVDVLDGLYAVPVGDVLEALRGLPDDCRTAAYVGHNPAAEALAHTLSGGSGDAAATRGLMSGFPPAAVAVLEVSEPWSELAEDCCRLTRFHVGGG